MEEQLFSLIKKLMQMIFIYMEI